MVLCEDWDGIFLQNGGIYLQIYTASYLDIFFAERISDLKMKLFFYVLHMEHKYGHN